jgi:hypothetical protein
MADLDELLALARRVFVVEGDRTYFAEHPSIVGLQLVDAIASLREALKPFARAAEDIDEVDDDRREMWEHPASLSVTVVDFRRARKALSPTQKPGNGE